MNYEEKNIIIAKWLGSNINNFHSDWNSIMLCLEKIAKDRKKTLLGTMEIVGYELSDELRTINNIIDLFDAIFNYITNTKTTNFDELISAIT